jgi:hypothetical protein
MKLRSATNPVNVGISLDGVKDPVIEVSSPFEFIQDERFICIF